MDSNITVTPLKSPYKMPTAFRLSMGALIITIFIFSASICRAGDENTGTLSAKDLPLMDIEYLVNMKVENVVSASKYSQKVTEAPSSISVITSDEIRTYGYRTLADILRSVRGFYTTYDRNFQYVGVRGFSRLGDNSPRILLLINGLRINDNIYNQASIGTDFPLDIELFDRVEIVRGPSSSLYGTNAFLAVVNIITKTGTQVHSFEATGEYGSLDAFKNNFSYGEAFSGKGDFLVSGTWRDSNGNKRLFYPEFISTPNHGVAENLDYDRSNSFFTVASLHGLTLQAARHSRTKGIPTAPWGMVFNDQRGKTAENNAFIDLKYEHASANDLNVIARTYWKKYSYRADYTYDYTNYESDPNAEPYMVLDQDFGWGEEVGFEAQAVKTYLKRYTIILGNEYRINYRQDLLNRDMDSPPTTYMDEQHDSNVWAFFLQGDARLIEKFRASAGLRYDHYDTFGSTLNPRISFIYQPLEKTSFKALYGKAFRAPSAYELYYDDGLSQIKNNNLKPEKIDTLELVMEEYISKNFRISFSGFQNKISDIIAQMGVINNPDDPGDDRIQFQNIDWFVSKGLECEVEEKMMNGISGLVSYVYTYANDSSVGKTVPNSPRHLAKFNLSFPLAGERLGGGIGVQYTGKMKTLRGNTLEDFILADFTLNSQKIYKGLDLSASVYNLFNTKYSNPGLKFHLQDAISQDGRTVRIQLKYQL